MIGATVVSAMIGGIGMALFPLVVGLLLAFVAYARLRLLPHGGPSGSRNTDSGLRPVATR